MLNEGRLGEDAQRVVVHQEFVDFVLWLCWFFIEHGGVEVGVGRGFEFALVVGLGGHCGRVGSQGLLLVTVFAAHVEVIIIHQIAHSFHTIISSTSLIQGLTQLLIIDPL